MDSRQAFEALVALVKKEAPRNTDWRTPVPVSEKKP